MQIHIFPLEYGLEILGNLAIGSFFKLSSLHLLSCEVMLPFQRAAKCSSEGSRNGSVRYLLGNCGWNPGEISVFCTLIYLGFAQKMYSEIYFRLLG